jgi:hypothetical protein
MCRRATLVAMLLLCAPLRAQQALFRNAAIGFGGGTILDMKTADVNKDGKPDVVLLEQQLSGFSIVTLLGSGNGTFRDPIVTPIATGSSKIALGDLDGDGGVDLVLSSNDSKLQTYRGSGDGSFALMFSQASSISGSPLVLADLDGDGKLDLIASTSNGPPAIGVTLITFRGHGDGSFNAGIVQPQGLVFLDPVDDITIGDFNGDGRIDVLESSFSGQRLALGNGDGSFNSPTTITNLENRAAVAGDFNGDGKLDFVGLGGREAFVYLGNGTGGFTKVASYTVGLTTRGVAVDIDGDGNFDVLMAGADSVTVMRGRGDGTFVVKAYTGSSNSFLLVSDFDGDHHLDVLTALPSSLLFLHGNGDGTLVAYRKSFIGSNPALPDSAFSPRGLATADFNGDGRADVVTANDGIIVLLNSGDGGFGAPIPLTVLPAASVTSLATGDVNGDGKSDIVVVGPTLNDGYKVWTYLGNGNGTFTATSPTAVAVFPFGLTLADVNGDGKLDVLLGGQLGGQLLLGHGDGTFAPPAALPGSPTVVADFNGDGRADFVADSFGTYTTFLNNGSGGFAAAGTRPDGSRALAVGDFNGDGKIDLVEEAFFGSSIVMRLGNGDGTFTDLPPITLPLRLQNLGGFPVVVGDFDGDGKLDLAFRNAVMLGKGDGTFRALMPCVPCATTFPTAFAAAADVDGNGSIDLLGVDGSNGAVDIFATRTAPAGVTPISLDLTSFSSPLHFQEPVDLTTTATTSSNSLLSGNVTIAVDGVLAGFVEWNSDRSAVFNWVPRSVGDRAITATFVGDDVFAPATVSLSQSVLRSVSFAELLTFLDPSQQKQPTPLNAFIAVEQDSIPNTTLPGGTITIREGDTVLFSGPYNQGGQPIFTYAFPTVGTHTLTMDYSGDTNYTPASATLAHVVVRDTLFVGQTATPASPLTQGQSLTLTALVSTFVDPSGGVVTFLDNGVSVGTAVTRGSFASIVIQPTWGFHSYTARYAGNADLDPASTNFALAYAVNLGPFGTPIEVRATAVSATNVNVDWSPLTGVTTYDLFRRGPGGSLKVFSGFTAPHVNDTTVAPNTTYLYQVVAHNNAGATSAPGARDWATTVPFTNDPLVPGATTVKALHITELRTAINAMRAAAGLPAATWSSDPTHAFIRATDLTELRVALAAARSALGAPVAFTDPTLTPRATTIRGIHFQEIRDAVK